MNHVQIDIEKFVRRMLPPLLRGPRMIAWLVVLLKPFVQLWQKYLDFRAAQLDMLQTNITVESIQAKLRQLYPAVGTYQVYVKTAWDAPVRQYDQFLGEHRPPAYDRFLSENHPPQYDTFLSERTRPADYTVTVPTAYTGDQVDIVAFLNRYRPAGKRFQLTFQNI